MDMPIDLKIGLILLPGLPLIVWILLVLDYRRITKGGKIF